MDISHWDASIHYDIQLAQYCDQTLSCYAISRGSPPLCSLALRLRNTKVPVWTPENGYQPLGRCNSLWHSACPTLQTRSFNAISRRSPPVYSFALKLRNTKVPVWTHESIGYPKMDISHWDAAIHYDIQLAQYCDQTLSCYAISRRSPPLCSLALRLRNTKVPVWTHESIGYPKMDISHWDAAIHYGVPENGHQPLGRGNSLWHSACPILWSNFTDLLTLFHRDRPLCTTLFTEIAPSGLPCPKTQEHQSTCVDSLRLRNTKVPVWTHESIGCPKIDISHWDAAIHYGVQLAQYCDQIQYCYDPLCSLAHRNTNLVTLFHYDIQKIAPSVLPCPTTQEHQSTCVDSWVHRVPENGHQPLGRGNSLWRSAYPILWSHPIL